MKKKEIFNFSYLLITVVLIFVLFSFSAFSQTEDFEFYKGKVIKFIVPYSVGGGFDVYTRAIAPYLEKYIPGVTVIVQNVPGGGSLIGTNTLYKADPDGLTIGLINGAGMALNQILGSEGVMFDLSKMVWLCRASADPRAMVVSTKTPFYTVEDMRKANREIVFAATGVGSDDYYSAAVIFRALGIPLRQVTGFPGSAEANLAVVRGEGVDGTEIELSSVSQFIEEGSMRPIIMITRERIGALPNIPTAVEAVPQENKNMVQVITNIFESNRVVCGPPGIPEERVVALRIALEKTFKDPEFIAWGESAKRPLDFLAGDKMDELIKEALKNAEIIKPILKEVTK